MDQTSEQRRYRIQGLLGQGGFGSVYRATLQGDHGFERDVAIKLLHPDIVDTSTLARFRDEARILGLVRDRAVVAVDPPTRLDGRWALIMEFVDGVSLSNLVKHIGTIPMRPALEIVQEVARVLDAVYRQPGPDGTPLRLLHRDLKPANLQLTPNGAVKVLDFGIAKAHFDAREAETKSDIIGTFKYMAPERLEAIDGPEADIYSLGTVLRQIALGDEPVGPGIIRVKNRPEGDPEILEAVDELGRQMTADTPEVRPTAREVEDRLQALVSRCRGDRLRVWAEHHLPANLPLSEDELNGSWMTETVMTRTSVSSDAPPTRVLSRALPLVAMAALIGVGGVVLTGLGVSIAGVLYANQDASTAETVDGGGSAPVAPPGPATAPSVDAPTTLVTDAQDMDATLAPAPVVDTPPTPAPVVDTPEAPAPVVAPPPVPASEPDTSGLPSDPPEPTDLAPAPDPSPSPALELPPEPATEVAPVPDPTPPPPTRPITIGSIPPGAEVVLEGRVLGRTPLIRADIPEGTHMLVLRHSDRDMVRTIVVGPDQPSRYVWNGDTWQSFQ